MKKIKMLILLFALLLVSCSDKSSVDENEIKSADNLESQQIIVTDSLGNEVEFDNNLENIDVVTMGASTTDLWLSIGGEVAGTTDDSLEDDSLELNGDVYNVGSVMSPTYEVLLANSPELVLLSANLSSHKELGELLNKTGIKTYYIDINSFEDYKFIMGELVKITGDDNAYNQNVGNIENEINEILDRVDEQFNPTVLLLRTSTSKLVPLTSEHFAGAILEDFGGINIAEEDGAIFETLNIESILEKDPDYIFVVAMGNDYDESMKKFTDYQSNNVLWNELTAVNEGRVIVLPKELFHNKPNARWSESYEYIYKVFFEQ